jgi:hypothetical protein
VHHIKECVGNPPHRNNRRIVESCVFFGVRPQAITGKQGKISTSLQSLQGWSLRLESALALVAKRGHGNAPRATVVKRGHDTTRHKCFKWKLKFNIYILRYALISYVRNQDMLVTKVPSYGLESRGSISGKKNILYFHHYLQTGLRILSSALSSDLRGPSTWG